MPVEARIKTSLVLICFTLVTWAVGHCLYQDGIGQEIRTQGRQPEQSIRLKHPAGGTDHQGKRLSKHARVVQSHNTSVFSGKAHSIGDMHKTSNNTERVTDDFQADDTDAFGIEMNRHEGQKSKKIEQLEKLYDADVFDTADAELERLSIVKPDNSGFKPHHDESYPESFRSDQAWSSDASPSSSSSSPYDAPPPPAFGLFAAVQELVLTVKDLHAQQDRDRRNIRQLKRRFETQSKDLSITRDLASECKSRVRRLEVTLGNLDARAGEMEVEAEDLRSITTNILQRNQELGRALTGMRSAQRDIHENMAEAEERTDICDKRLTALEESMKAGLEGLEAWQEKMSRFDGLAKGTLDDIEKIQSKERVHGRRGEKQKIGSSRSSDKEKIRDAIKVSSDNESSALNVSFVIKEEPLVKMTLNNKTRRRIRRYDKKGKAHVQVSMTNQINDSYNVLSKASDVLDIHPSKSVSAQDYTGSDYVTGLVTTGYDITVSGLFKISPTSSKHSLPCLCSAPQSETRVLVPNFTASEKLKQTKGFGTDFLSVQLEPSQQLSVTSLPQATATQEFDIYKETLPVTRVQETHMSETPIWQIPREKLQSSKHYEQFGTITRSRPTPSLPYIDIKLSSSRGSGFGTLPTTLVPSLFPEIHNFSPGVERGTSSPTLQQTPGLETVSEIRQNGPNTKSSPDIKMATPSALPTTGNVYQENSREIELLQHRSQTPDVSMVINDGLQTSIQSTTASSVFHHPSQVTDTSSRGSPSADIFAAGERVLQLSYGTLDTDLPSLRSVAHQHHSPHTLDTDLPSLRSIAHQHHSPHILDSSVPTQYSVSDVADSSQTVFKHSPSSAINPTGIYSDIHSVRTPKTAGQLYPDTSMLPAETTRGPNLTQILDIVRDLVKNETARIEAEIEKQKRELRRSRLLLREELGRRDATLRVLEGAANRTTADVKDLTQQVSAINLDDFISKMEDNMDDFVQNVLTQDQRGDAANHAMNATKQNARVIDAVHKAHIQTARRLASLENSTASFQALTQRWYRNLQGHVIRLNNSAQDMREQMGRKLDSTQVKALQADGAATRTEVQAEIESLRVQFLYNANRLGSLETNLLNATLANCRRSSQDQRQAARMATLQEKYNDAQKEIFLLKEKVKHTDLNVFRAQNQITENYRAVEGVVSAVRDLGPAVPVLKTVTRDVENIVHQVLPDCHAYFQMGYRKSGVYTIHPGTLGNTLRVFCVMVGHGTQHARQDVPGVMKLAASEEDIAPIGRARAKARAEPHAEDQTTRSELSVETTVAPTPEEPKHVDDQVLEREEFLRKKSLEDNERVRNKAGDFRRRGDISPAEIADDDKNSSAGSQRSVDRKKRKRRKRRRGKSSQTKENFQNKRNKKRRRKREATLNRRKQRRKNTRRRKTNRERVENVNNSAGQSDLLDQAVANTNKKDETAKVRNRFDQAPTEPPVDVKSQPPESDEPRSPEGGWTVVQRRRHGSVNFTQSWAQYATGFGSVERDEDYWLGNEALHHLTKREPLELRVVMEDVFSSVWEATYTRFRVAGRGDNYRIQLSGYHGNASDALSQCNLMTFSTVDRPGERGGRGEYCARHNGAGWWYPHCHVSNLNGPYPLGMLWFNNAWLDWVQVKSSLLMVRPRKDSRRWP